MSSLDTIPVLGVVFEPSVVIGLLLFGVILNRNRDARKQEDTIPQKSDDSEQYNKYSILGKEFQVPSTAKFRRNRVSRFVASFPFLFEVLYWACTYWFYQIGRAITAFSFDEGVTEEARSHGIQILHAEQALGMNVETQIQAYFMARPLIMSFLNNFYSFVHIPASIAFFCVLFKIESHKNFSAIRRTLTLCNWIAFIIFSIYPAMPPRLLPESYGFIDTVHKTKTASVWTTNKFCNQYAAMPSLHFGYSFIIGCSLIAYGPLFKKRLNFLAAAYPILIFIAIVATANHYVLDAVAGFFVACLGFFANQVLLALLPLENWILYLLHIHKPACKDELVSAEKSVEMEGLLEAGVKVSVDNENSSDSVE